MIEDLSKCADLLLYALASCHSITKLNGEFIGDILEVKMFAGTTWSFDEVNIIIYIIFYIQ